VGNEEGGAATVVVVVGGGGGDAVVVVVGGEGEEVVVVGGGVDVVVAAATGVVAEVVEVEGGVVVVVDAEFWVFDPVDPDDEFPENEFRPEFVDESNVRCWSCEEIGVEGTMAETVAVDVTADVVPAEPWFLMAADASMLTIAAKTLDATISVTTLEIRRLPFPNLNCRRVPLLMNSKFAEQNHAATNSTSTTTQFRREQPNLPLTRSNTGVFKHFGTRGGGIDAVLSRDSHPKRHHRYSV